MNYLKYKVKQNIAIADYNRTTLSYELNKTKPLHLPSDHSLVFSSMLGISYNKNKMKVLN